MEGAGGRAVRFLETVAGLGALLLITISVIVTKAGVARQVMHPLIRRQILRAGLQIMPMVTFLSIALGLAVIGQTVFLLSRFGAQSYAGTVMATVVVREMGPILAALVVLARVGAANVIELGTARAMGEIEALEALGIDPVHYLIAPRVIGMALSTLALTVYMILFSLAGGYVFAFLQDVPLMPGEYFGQIASALIWEDFAFLALKTLAFGMLIAVVTCYEGLARPLRLEDVAGATTRAMAISVVGTVLIDAAFIVFYLLIR
jgi:phospholipid/cholesterol/gamma-HCH transport system permease protein